MLNPLVPAAVFLVQSILPATIAQPTMIRVDCNAGDSLEEALHQAQLQGRGPLLVEVSGVCKSSVTITRSDLTLRGDGTAILKGPAAGSGFIVNVSDARNTAIENLSIEVFDPPVGFRALSADHSELSVRNVTIAGEFGSSSQYGIFAEGSDVELTDVMLDLDDSSGFDGGFPIAAWAGTTLTALRVEVLADNANVDIRGSAANLNGLQLRVGAGSFISGPSVFSFENASVRLTNSRMDPGLRVTVLDRSHASVSFSSGYAPGLIATASGYSSISLSGIVTPELVELDDSAGVVGSAGEAVLEGFSELKIGEVETLFVGGFSRAIVEESAETVICEDAGSVLCPPGSVSSSSCAACVPSTAATEGESGAVSSGGRFGSVSSSSR